MDPTVPWDILGLIALGILFISIYFHLSGRFLVIDEEE